MEGIKCPVCQAISEAQGIKDGELVKCGYCKSKYTVIKNRRYSILPLALKTHLPGNKDCEGIEVFVKQLDYDMLLQLLKIVSANLVAGYKKRE